MLQTPLLNLLVALLISSVLKLQMNWYDTTSEPNCF